MKKDEIYAIVGGLCIGIGACIISTGLCFVIIGIMFLIGSFLEYCKREDEEEPEAPSQKKYIWHDVKLNTPGSDSEIMLLDSKSKKHEVCVYYKESDNLYFFDYEDPYTWEGGIKGTIYDKWCYVNDLIENGTDLQ